MRVDIQGLQKTFDGRRAVDVPALTIPDGQAFGLVGSNGAGKTTFLRMMLDLLRPDAGTIRLGGYLVGRDTGWKTHTGSFLDPSFLLPFLSVDEFLGFVGRVYGLGEQATREALEAYAAFFGPDVLRQDRLVRDLSLGNKKKVGIVGAIFFHPRLVVLDEPFANLDPPSQIRLLHHLQALRDDGVTLVVSSHDLLHVTELCTRIAILDEGRIARDLQTSDATLGELEAFFGGEV